MSPGMTVWPVRSTRSAFAGAATAAAAPTAAMRSRLTTMRPFSIGGAPVPSTIRAPSSTSGRMAGCWLARRPTLDAIATAETDQRTVPTGMTAPRVVFPSETIQRRYLHWCRLCSDLAIENAIITGHGVHFALVRSNSRASGRRCRLSVRLRRRQHLGPARRNGVSGAAPPGRGRICRLRMGGSVGRPERAAPAAQVLPHHEGGEGRVVAGRQPLSPAGAGGAAAPKAHAFLACVKTMRRPYFWLLKIVAMIVPPRLRASWRQEWEAELA